MCVALRGPGDCSKEFNRAVVGKQGTVKSRPARHDLSREERGSPKVASRARVRRCVRSAEFKVEFFRAHDSTDSAGGCFLSVRCSVAGRPGCCR